MTKSDSTPSANAASVGVALVFTALAVALGFALAFAIAQGVGWVHWGRPAGWADATRAEHAAKEAEVAARITHACCIEFGRLHPEDVDVAATFSHAGRA